MNARRIASRIVKAEGDALLRAAQYTLLNLDYAAEHGLITADRGMQAQLGESAEMLREAIRGRLNELAGLDSPESTDPPEDLRPYERAGGGPLETER